LSEVSLFFYFRAVILQFYATQQQQCEEITMHGVCFYEDKIRVFFKGILISVHDLIQENEAYLSFRNAQEQFN